MGFCGLTAQLNYTAGAAPCTICVKRAERCEEYFDFLMCKSRQRGTMKVPPKPKANSTGFSLVRLLYFSLPTGQTRCHSSSKNAIQTQ